jgi:flagellar basal-body rod protein FlgG
MRDRPYSGHYSAADGVLTEIARFSSKIQSDMSEESDDSGLAYQMALEIIAHNLANVNTTGFKRTKLQFQELPGQSDGNPKSVLDGAEAPCTTRLFSAGELKQTGELLDIAIQGEGLFELILPDGTHAYTRDGAFKIDSDGHFVSANGFRLCSGFQPIQSGITSITIASDGKATCTGPQGKTTFQLVLCRFANPAGLEAIGHNLYRETPASGAAELGHPRADGWGELIQGYLELSNVNVAEELVELIRIQRAYEVNPIRRPAGTAPRFPHRAVPDR